MNPIVVSCFALLIWSSIGQAQPSREAIPPQGSIRLASEGYRISDTLQAICRDFIEPGDCDSCIIELIVDRFTWEAAVFSLRRLPLLPGYRAAKPLLYLRVDGVDICVYVGIEDYLRGRGITTNVTKTSTTQGCPPKTVSYIERLGVFRKTEEDLPFERYLKAPIAVPDADSLFKNRTDSKMQN